MKKFLLSSILAITLVFPITGSAQVVASGMSSADNIQAQIRSFTIELIKAQIADLQAQLAEMIGNAPDQSTQETVTDTEVIVSEGTAQDEIDLKTAQCSNAKYDLEAVRVSEDQNDSDYTTKSTTIHRMVKMGYYGSGDGGLANLILSYKAQKKSLALQETKAITNVSELCN